MAKSSRERVEAVCRRIEESEEPPSLEEMAEIAGLSPHHFHRVFKEATGLTPRAYAAARRAERVRKALGKRTTVTEAFYEAGFGSSGRFYSEAERLLGMSPSAYRTGGAGEAIRFAVGRCSLGSILVAVSEKGVCGVFLHDDPEELVRELQRRFRNAELQPGDGDFEQWVARVVGMVEEPWKETDLPLDIRGTAFQQKVWDALREIPVGSTSSYAEIAAKIGLPKAVRAVAGACAANAIAVAIPCHRVVRTDGGISGYRWGVERKRALLEREARGL